MPEAVSLERRIADLTAAEDCAVEVAERWLIARAGRRMTLVLEAEMDEAQRALLAAKRRYERTLRRA